MNQNKHIIIPINIKDEEYLDESYDSEYVDLERPSQASTIIQSIIASIQQKRVFYFLLISMVIFVVVLTSSTIWSPTTAKIIRYPRDPASRKLSAEDPICESCYNEGKFCCEDPGSESFCATEARVQRFKENALFNCDKRN